MHLRVFLSSPGDVVKEREFARKLIKDELPSDPFLGNKIQLDVVSWDDPAAPMPMPAQLTPQEAVNRFGPKPSECDIVVVVLWSRLGTQLDGRTFQKPNGEPYSSGTEYEYEEADSSPRPLDILVYRRTEKFPIYPDDPHPEEKLAQYRKAQAFFDRFKNPDGSYKGGYREYGTPSEFKALLEKNLKRIIKERLDAAQPLQANGTDAGPTGNNQAVWTKPPYPGLRPFRDDEADIFFGRERETDELIARLREPRCRFLAVVGASGTGKSSLIYAGLLPSLKKNAIEGSMEWRVVWFRPGSYGDNPFLALASTLKPLLPKDNVVEPVELASELEREPATIAAFVDQTLTDAPTSAQLVLFVDQLEELFTQAAGAYQQAFVNLLARAARHSQVRVLAVLRADFMPQALQYPELTILLQSNSGTFPHGPPGQAALTDMIRRPARLAGVTLEDSLTNEILKDVGSDLGALPLVAFCLNQLYDQSTDPSHKLTVQDYHNLGRLRGAVGRHAVAAVSKFQKKIGRALGPELPTLFRALVHVDAAGIVASHRAFRDKLAAEPSLPHLVDELIQKRLLVTDDADGRATIALAHEALLTAWPALQEWINNNQAQLQRLSKAQALLEHANPKSRLVAVEELSILAIEDRSITEGMVEEAVQPLIGTLGDADPRVRKGAATALGQIGPAAAKAVPALINTLRDSDTAVRSKAARVLGQIGPAAAEAVPALITALGDAAWRVHDNAFDALKDIGLEAVPTLIRALGDADWKVGWRAGEILEAIGAAAVPALDAALKSPDPDVANAAKGILERMQSASLSEEL